VLTRPTPGTDYQVWGQNTEPYEVDYDRHVNDFYRRCWHIQLPGQFTESCYRLLSPVIDYRVLGQNTESCKVDYETRERYSHKVLTRPSDLCQQPHSTAD